MSMNEIYDVAIVGLGPTGIMAANLLAQRGLKIAIIERDTSVFPRQRAIALDEDALRILQSAGLDRLAMKDMDLSVCVHYRHKGRVFLTNHFGTVGRQGFPLSVFFHQPALEETMRQGLDRFSDNVSFFYGHELLGVEQDQFGVRLTAVEVQSDDDPKGKSIEAQSKLTMSSETLSGPVIEVNAKYALACDGGSSSTRKQVGIPLEGWSVSEPWIDIQARAWYERDPSAPLDFNFISDPERPGVECSATKGHHRWEFRLHPDEDPKKIDTPEGIRKLLATRGVDSSKIEILRHWHYVFHVRSAKAWRKGRVFLLGDSAHIMPPFAGQGVSSGFRDAANLCWKIGAVLDGNADESILDTYESERRRNVDELTRLSLRIGNIVMTQSRVVAALRDVGFRFAMRLPKVGTWLRSGGFKPQYELGNGFLARRRSLKSPAGQFVWQPWVLDSEGLRKRLDDLLGNGWIYLSMETPNMPSHLADLGVKEIVVKRWDIPLAGLATNEIVDIEATLEKQFRRHRARGLLIRPDRFIFGSNRDDLHISGLTSTECRSDRTPVVNGVAHELAA